MCSIFGSYGPAGLPLDEITRGAARGRDSWGYASSAHRDASLGAAPDFDGARYTPDPAEASWIIGNTRAEPTTEWVREKSLDDVQPFRAGALTLAHNGTFANDVELAEAAGVDLDALPMIDSARWVAAASARGVEAPEDALALLDETVGSYGLALGHDSGWLLLATNYRPIWTRLILTPGTGPVPGASLRFTSIAPRDKPYGERLAEGWEMLPPYHALVLRPGDAPVLVDRRPPRPERALVVCSGGMDSTVAATLVARERPVDLLHVTYGCRAEGREIEAVTMIAERLGAGLRFLDLTDVFRAIGASRLTRTAAGDPSTEGGGVAGAEYASEWVPARNLILLAIATGIAEGGGYGSIVLGNNVEEAGAYPDNEQEFIGRLGDLLPFAVRDGARVDVLEPVGNLTKREIVERGLAAGAPLDVTWSCYEGGERHCGACGPCFMRRTAFAMAGTRDPMEYAG